MTAAHEQKVTNRYEIMYPAHEPREHDPNYKDFHEWKRRQRETPGAWRCAWGAEIGDDSECDLTAPLEAHHGHIEFALANAIDLAHLEHVYPGVSNPDEVGAWIESAENLVLYCRLHHRSAAGGIHHLSASDFEASKFLQAGVFRDASPEPTPGS